MDASLSNHKPDQRESFASARFGRSIFGGCRFQLLSQDAPLFGPWFLSVPEKLYGMAIQLRTAGQKAHSDEFIECAITAGVIARRFETFERKEVKDLFTGRKPDGMGALRDEDTQLRIAKAALSAMNEVCPLIGKLKSEVRSAHEQVYNSLMQAACDAERRRRKIEAGLDPGPVVQKEDVPSEPGEPIEAADLLRQVLDMRPHADTADEKLLIEEVIEWLTRSMELEKAGPAALADKGALEKTGETMESLHRQFTSMIQLARERAFGQDPWYELIEYETFELMRRSRR